jgi:hypothetical protein
VYRLCMGTKKGELSLLTVYFGQKWRRKSKIFQRNLLCKGVTPDHSKVGWLVGVLLGLLGTQRVTEEHG